MSIPDALDFSAPGFAYVHRYTPDVIYPTGSWSNSSNDAAIRFNIKRKAFWDPWTAYFRITVTAPQQYLVGQKSPLTKDFNFTSTAADQTITTAVGTKTIVNSSTYGWDNAANPPSAMRGLVLDHSAMSLFREILITDSNIVVERIRNLDILAAMLNDIHFYDNDQRSRRWGGFGGLTTATMQSGASKCQSINAGGVTCFSGLDAGATLGIFTPYGDPVNIWSNPLISQFNASVGKVYHTRKQVPVTYLGSSTASSTSYIANTQTVYNGITSLHFSGSIPTMQGTTAGVANADFGQGIPQILNITGNNFSGCPYTPSTINLLDMSNQDSPYFCPPLSYDDYISIGMVPETTGYLPWTTPYSQTAKNTANVDASVFTFPQTDATQIGPVTIEFGTSTNAQYIKKSPALPLASASTSPNQTRSSIQIRDLTDGVRNYSEFINGTPTLFNAAWAQTSFEPVLSYDMTVSSCYNGSSSYEALTSSLTNTPSNPITTLLTSTSPIIRPSKTQLSQTFLVPLPSTIIGKWVPADKYKLTPLMGFQDLVIEMRLNPHAFYTTFFAASNDARRYQIDNIELRFELAEFFDSAIESSVNSALKTGLTLYTHGWMNCLSYTISGTNIPNNIQINTSFASLKMFLFCFIDNAYQNASCYRKQFRLSPNINQHWLKIGADNYPVLPYIADSGTNTGVNNSNETYFQFLQAFGMQHTPGQHAINPSNMSIGQRRFYFNSGTVAWYNSVITALFGTTVTAQLPYPGALGGLSLTGSTAGPFIGDLLAHPLDINTLSQMIPVTSVGGNSITNASSTGMILAQLNAALAANTTIVSSSTNAQGGTQAVTFQASPEYMFAVMAFCGNLQYCYYCENQMVGRAMFAIDLDELNYTGEMYSGVSTEGARPFDLMIKNNMNGIGTFQGQMNLEAWGYYDITLVLKAGTPAKASGYS